MIRIRTSSTFALLLLAASAAAAQQQPSSRPGGESLPATAPKAGAPETPPTDAEKIARLQRTIEESNAQIATLTVKLNDPESEFQQAQAAFAELDLRLAELKKSLNSPELRDPERRGPLERDRAELEPKHALAKQRFDLAIRERKMLQEQIATLLQKAQQDNDALRKLMGETPATSQPAAESAAGAGMPAGVGAPAPTAAPGAATAQPAPTQEPPAPTAAPAPVGAAPVQKAPLGPAPPAAAPQGQAPAPPSPELIEARQEAVRRHAEAQTAQVEAESVTERVKALQKSIELEQRLYETSRQKVENAQATERAIYESMRKKWQDGSPASELPALRQQIAEARDRLHDAENETRERTDRLGKLQSDLSALQAEHIAAMEEARRTEAEAEAAQKRVEHLESPLSPRNMWRWLLLRGPRVGGILLAMIAIAWACRVAENRLVGLIARRGGPGTAEDRENRARTLVGIVHSATTVAVYAGGGLMILTEVGVNIVPLMGGAAVLGLAVAFGAQNLIRDYFYGFMILLESQYTINDVVKIGDVSGQVERITLRVTVLRGLDGSAHFVPNGEITRVTNMTHGWSRALFDIPVAYKEDVDRVMGELVELAKELRRDPDYRGQILEMPEMLGVNEFGESAVVIKFLIKTRPLKQWAVKRELLRRIKKRFDELGIEIPFPHRTVYHRTDGDGLVPSGGGLHDSGDAALRRDARALEGKLA